MTIFDTIRQMLDQAQEEHRLDMINTVCMIDECHRLDTLLHEALLKEGLLETKMDDEIEEMILDDIQHWVEVYNELDNQYDYEYDDWE